MLSKMETGIERERVEQALLLPVITRFNETLLQFKNGRVEMLDSLINFLECFSGAAKASAPGFAKIIFSKYGTIY
jgi:hypothetical protein